MPRAPRPLLAVLAALVVLLALSGCGEDRASGSGETGGGGSSVTIDITVKDGKVEPHGSKVKVKAGEPVHLKIDSDASDELHVHSSPEQEVAFGKGQTEKTLTLDQPGVVDIEIHDLDKLVVQLEVR